MSINLKLGANPGKLSVRHEGRIKLFSDIQDFKIFVSMYPYSKRFWGMCSCNPRWKPRKKKTRDGRNRGPHRAECRCGPRVTALPQAQRAPVLIGAGGQRAPEWRFPEKGKNAPSVLGLGRKYYRQVCKDMMKYFKKKRGGHKTLSTWNSYHLKKKVNNRNGMILNSRQK